MAPFDAAASRSAAAAFAVGLACGAAAAAWLLRRQAARAAAGESEIDVSAIPEACPGLESEAAGKGAACAGCPNQAACASGATKAAVTQVPTGVKERRGRRRDCHDATRGVAVGREKGNQLLQEERALGCGRRGQHDKQRLRTLSGPDAVDLRQNERSIPRPHLAQEGVAGRRGVGLFAHGPQTSRPVVGRLWVRARGGLHRRQSVNQHWSGSGAARDCRRQ
eukprot:Selendium_serpulae@DN2592_c0_g1_i2.p2